MSDERTSSEIFDDLLRATDCIAQEEHHFDEAQPLLAHYTSLQVFESILNRGEFWFSNPLQMNDFEEVRFGLVAGLDQFLVHKGVESLYRDREQHLEAHDSLRRSILNFGSGPLLDCYVLCFSEHQRDDHNGALSMWRGYGGDGHGVALVFDTKELGASIPDHPLVLGKVNYMSEASYKAWVDSLLDQMVSKWQELEPSNSQISIFTYVLATRLIQNSLFTKHEGFFEEREWRIVYRADADKKQILSPMLSYSIGPSGASPRLKLPLASIPRLSNAALTLEQLIDRILIGPGQSTDVSVHAIRRLIEQSGHSTLAEKVYVSQTPYRSRGNA